jgi:hypothetical protein
MMLETKALILSVEYEGLTIPDDRVPDAAEECSMNAWIPTPFRDSHTHRRDHEAQNQPCTHGHLRSFLGSVLDI